MSLFFNLRNLSYLIELIGTFLSYALDHCVVKDGTEE